MLVSIDGRPLRCPADTLSAALICARDAAGDRLIVQIRADGFEIPSTDLDEPPSRAPYATRIDFTTADAGELLAGMLQDAAGALDIIAPVHARAADEIRGGRLDQAMHSLGEVLRTWAEVRSAMELASRTGNGRAGVTEQSTDQLVPVLNGLADRLAEIKRTLVSSDWSSLADVLAYDMDDQVARCRSWLLGARGG